MADEQPIPPLSRAFVPLTAKVAPALSPGGTQPPVDPKALDNPPRTRVISSGPSAPSAPFQTAPAQYLSQDPFAGLTLLDVFNIREALRVRLADLEQDPGANVDNKAATKRVFDLVCRKINPPVQSMVPVPPPPLPRPSFVPGDRPDISGK